jgi:hypothetical protein
VAGFVWVNPASQEQDVLKIKVELRNMLLLLHRDGLWVRGRRSELPYIPINGEGDATTEFITGIA